MRYFFEISYNGTNYHGWQNQAYRGKLSEHPADLVVNPKPA
jgi:tRNA U38,U39,U40 pseudouridine synthase TruA